MGGLPPVWTVAAVVAGRVLTGVLQAVPAAQEPVLLHAWVAVLLTAVVGVQVVRVAQVPVRHRAVVSVAAVALGHVLLAAPVVLRALVHSREQQWLSTYETSRIALQ